MPTVRFLARTIEAIKLPANGRVEYWDRDNPGFGLRVSDRGTKAWIAMYRHGGRLRRLTIGRYPRLGLADAREKALDALRAAEKGGDPAGDKQRSRQAETFKELAEDYLARYAKKRKRSWRKDEAAIHRDLVPRFGRRKAQDITRRDVRLLLDEILNRGAPIQANRTLEILRRMYNWGIEEEIVRENPCARIKKPSLERSRDVVLNDDQIRAFWAGCQAANSPIRAMFHLRLATVQRGGEISRMRLADVDLDVGWWTIPAEHSKNGLPHRVPLNSLAISILREVWPEVGDWVFPGQRRGQPITAIAKAAAAIRQASGVAFVPHDLRRTGASVMAGLGIPRLTIAKLLNHVERDVTAVYDRHSYDAEKRAAIEAWGRKLESVLGLRQD